MKLSSFLPARKELLTKADSNPHTAKVYLSVGLLVASLGLGNPTQAELQYTITDLGSLDGTHSEGLAINASGQVTGSSSTANDVVHQSHAFITHSDGSMTDLGTLGGKSSAGNGINDSGQVTGWASTANDRPSHAFTTNSAGKMIDWGSVGEIGDAINASGQVTGMNDDSKAFIIQPNDGTMTVLGTLGGNWSHGLGINASGHVTGMSLTANGDTHAFTTHPSGVMTDLGTLSGGSGSVGKSINASGQVTGHATTKDGYPHAFIASPGRPMIDLGTLGGDYSEGHGINASGQVVGLFAGGGFVTDNGIMKDLNTLLPSGSGWKILIARAINDAGQITGKGSHNGKQRAFLLTPSSGSSNPDPKTCLMNWAEATYPSLFAPAGAATQIAAPYTYRYYLKSDAYLGVSAADNHVYYLGADRVLLDAGDLASWLTKAKCQ